MLQSGYCFLTSHVGVRGVVFPPSPKYDCVIPIPGFHSRNKGEIKMETFQYRKSRIWEMKEDKYTKSLPGLCNSSYARYSEKSFTQIYKALYGEAMFVSLSGAQIWPPENNRNICFWVFLLMREFFAWGTHKD